MSKLIQKALYNFLDAWKGSFNNKCSKKFLQAIFQLGIAYEYSTNADTRDLTVNEQRLIETIAFIFGNSEQHTLSDLIASFGDILLEYKIQTSAINLLQCVNGDISISNTNLPQTSFLKNIKLQLDSGGHTIFENSLFKNYFSAIQKPPPPCTHISTFGQLKSADVSLDQDNLSLIHDILTSHDTSTEIIEFNRAHFFNYTENCLRLDIEGPNRFELQKFFDTIFIKNALVGNVIFYNETGHLRQFGKIKFGK